MSFTVANVFSKVDLLLADSAKTRWPDLTTRLLWYNAAVQRIRSDRPDARYHPDTGNLVPYAAATAVADVSILDDIWEQVVVSYVTSYCFMQDAEDQRDLSRAKEFKKDFEDALLR